MPYKSLVEHIENNRKELTKLKQEAYQLGFDEGVKRATIKFLEDLKIFQNECANADYNNFDPMQYIEEVIEKWEGKKNG